MVSRRRVIRGLSAGCENGGDRGDRDVVVFSGDFHLNKAAVI